VTVPSWLLALSRCAMLMTLGWVGFAGWHLQAKYGMQGLQVASLGLDAADEHWTAYEHLGVSRVGPSRSELRAAMNQQRAVRLGLGHRPAAAALLTGVVAPEWIAEANKGSHGNGQLTWPVKDGWFGRGWGSGESSYHAAVDIDGERGSHVLAAAPGIVGYAGKELRGYGNVVLIVHPGGWVTLYAHNQKFLVSAGERVEQGQPIAELGSTGRSMGPHVHFELIYKEKNCDPLPFVKRESFSHRHYPETAPIVPFNPTAGKPAAVRCKKRMMHPTHDDADDESLLGANAHKHVHQG
jgi:murein DD-endopeptidase MepM/ murein hydrolase activator NlpD